MTNPAPREPQQPIPERRKRPATGVTFDEMIAIIVAFSTIGTILFWSIGNKNNKFASNLSLNKNNSLLASDKTTDTGLGLSSILSRGTEEDLGSNKDLKAKNSRLATQRGKQKATAAKVVQNNNVPRNNKLKRSQKKEKKSFDFNSGAKLAPVAGVATLPSLFGNSGNAKAPESTDTAVKPEATAPESTDPAVKPEATAPEATDPAVKPEATAPESTDTAVKPEATAPEATDPAVKPETTAPESTKMPDDVVPDYWAYPFVKQMRDKGLVPELAKNQEFEPDALITRASMATLVSQAFKGQPQTKSAKKFTDVVKGNAISKDVDQAVSTGFMQGYSDNEFRPLENIPRYQVLVTLATGLGLKPSQDADQILQKFGDSSKMPDWAKQQVAAAAEAGLLVNPPDADANSLVPERSATRGEVAAMIHQALVKTGKLKPLESEYIVKP